jgi:hypothetical protein
VASLAVEAPGCEPTIRPRCSTWNRQPGNPVNGTRLGRSLARSHSKRFPRRRGAGHRPPRARDRVRSYRHRGARTLRLYHQPPSASRGHEAPHRGARRAPKAIHSNGWFSTKPVDTVPWSAHSALAGPRARSASGRHGRVARSGPDTAGAGVSVRLVEGREALVPPWVTPPMGDPHGVALRRSVAARRTYPQIHRFSTSEPNGSGRRGPLPRGQRSVLGVRLDVNLEQQWWNSQPEVEPSRHSRLVPALVSAGRRAVDVVRIHQDAHPPASTSPARQRSDPRRTPVPTSPASQHPHWPSSLGMQEGRSPDRPGTAPQVLPAACSLRTRRARRSVRQIDDDAT